MQIVNFTKVIPSPPERKMSFGTLNMIYISLIAMLIVTLFLLFICFVHIDIVKTCILYGFEGCNTLNKWMFTCQIFFVNKILKLRKSATNRDEE